MSSFVDRKFLQTFDLVDKVCVESPERSVTYAEFHGLVYRLMRCFDELLLPRSREVQPRIGILCRNSVEHLALIYAAYFSGVSWTSLNTQLPSVKLEAVLDSLQPDLLFFEDRFEALLDPSRRRTMRVDDPEHFDFSQRVGRAAFEAAINPSKSPTAYVIFTSGSTGAQKGVAISYAALENYLESSADDLEFGAHTRNLSITPYYFDAPLGTIFLTLIFGGTIYLHPSSAHPGVIAKLLVDKEITYIGATPGLLKYILHAVAAIGRQCKLRVVGVGGDDLIKKDVQQILEIVPGLKILNRYGPTETTSVAASFAVDPEDLASFEKIPIGRPLANVVFEVLTSSDELLSGSGEGELLIGGAQNMLGYWRDPDLTDRVTWRRADGMKLYRTGDLVRRDERGLYFYLSRCNRMVKKNGYRVFLGEIENSVNDLAYIEHALCVEDEDSPGRVLCVVTSARSNLDCATIAEDLRRVLPPYMLPDAYYQAADIALTHVGKFDAATIKQRLGRAELRQLA